MKQNKPKTHFKTRAQKRAERNAFERCPQPGCIVPKDAWAVFCWIHWWKLTKDLRIALSQLKGQETKKPYKELMKKAKAYLKEACKPLNS